MDTETKRDMNAFLDAFMDFSALAGERKLWRTDEQVALFGIYVNDRRARL